MLKLGFDKLTVNNKLKWGLGASILLLLISAIISFNSIVKLIGQSKLVEHTNQVMLNLENLGSSLKDAETSQRGYLLSNDTKFLRQYKEAYPLIMAYYNNLRDLTSDNAFQLSNLQSLKELIEQRFERMAHVIEQHDRFHRIAKLDMLEGKVLMDRCRVLINRMQQEANRTLKIRTDEVNQYGDYSLIVIVISSILSLAVAIVSFVFIVRDISRKETTQRELSRFNHLLNGMARLNDLLRGEKDMQISGDKIIGHLCTFTGAQAGVLYINSDDNRFHLTNTCACADESSIPAVFGYGEGIPGESAAQQKKILVDSVPPESVRIRSGLAAVKPVTILAVPFCRNGETIAVAELLHTSTFDALDLEFLDNASETIATFISSLKAELRTGELLAETQTQAEELEAQQEEMRQMNDDLREQRDRLQASEEELRASEEELQEKNSELELQYETVRSRNKALEDARQAVQLKVQQVETASRYKTEFLANMSHELRTPLNSILIFAGLLKQNNTGHLSEKEIEQARIIEKSGNDLLRLINEILDVARVEAGKIKLELKEHPISDFNPEKQFSELARERNINFEVNIHPDAPAVILTDRFRVEQVLKNLLSNAFKFTPAGGTVTFEITPRQDVDSLKNPALRKEELVAFSVKDTGIGIAEDKKELVFEPFQQADASTTRKYGGSGLGLTISHDIALLLGGEITLESTPGKGSEFTLFLPLNHHAAEHPVKDSAAENGLLLPQEEKSEMTDNIPTLSPASSSENRILIVEDDMYFSKMLAEYAGKKGYVVDVAHNGKEALEKAQKRTPQAILLDVQLPDMNGWDVLKKIKSMQVLRSVPVHMMSAYDRGDIPANMGHADFIPKPVTLEKLDIAFRDIHAMRNALKKVLVVEDNETENLAIRELLRSHSIEALHAHRGKDALNTLRSEKYDCVILDISLPDINGYDVLREMKKDPALAEIPVIIYSGRDLSEEEDIELRKYANTIVIKTAHSYTRLLEEVKLFLHTVDSSLSVSAAPPPLVKPDGLLKGRKVLIADDDVRNIFSLHSLLETYDMEIVAAYDGKQAVEKLKENPDTEIVLMDMMMPEMDGIEATKAIRAIPSFRNLPIIAVTAKAMEGDKEKCLAAGVSDYIAKPIDINRLLSLMRVWIYKG